MRIVEEARRRLLEARSELVRAADELQKIAPPPEPGDLPARGDVCTVVRLERQRLDEVTLRLARLCG